ncbi:MAG: hypothetical protein KDD21_09495 [Bacteroidetes bacterium]|nr:hypothetical protein [Bacteroidota bacterium]
MNTRINKFTIYIIEKNLLPLKIIARLCLFLFSFPMLMAQNTQVQFGQNRVQYHKFDWQYYNSDNFTIYFYPGGQEIGKFVGKLAEMKLDDLNKQMDFHFNSQVDILVYNTISDLAQTNIGLGQEDYNIGGTTVLRDNKIFLHFNGNHRDLQRDLMKGLSELYVRQMMAGQSFGQKIQNAIFVVMPDWYRNGLSSFMGEPWNTQLDAQLKKYFQTAKKIDFNRLVNTNATLAGQSFWYMISEVYGTDAVPNILYLTRVNHSIDKGFIYAVNADIKQLMNDWKTFYLNRFELDARNRDSITNLQATKIKKRNNNEIGDMQVSVDGKYAAYATFDGGFYKVFIQDLQTKKSKKVAKGGFRSDQYPFDKSYPILTWSKSGHRLIVISEKKDIIRLTQIDYDNGKKTKSNLINFQKVYGVDFLQSANMLVLSAQNKGQTDLYLYNVASKSISQINNDVADDLYPKSITTQYGNGILFSSNRQQPELLMSPNDSVLPLQTLDLFYYNLDTKSTNLARVTETPFANEQAVGNYTNTQYTFLSDENGIKNLYVGDLDSFFLKNDTITTTINENTDSASTQISLQPIYSIKGNTFPISNFKEGLEKAAVTKQNSYLFFGVNKRKSYLYTQKNLVEEQLSEQNNVGLNPTSFRKFYRESVLQRSPNAKEPESISNKINKEASKIGQEISMDSLLTEPFNYTFESDYNTTIFPSFEDVPNSNTKTNSDINAVVVKTDSVKILATDSTKNDELAPPPFLQDTPVASNTNTEPTTGKKIRILPYRAKFTSDYVVTQLDNSILTQSYQSFNQNLGSYNFPNLSGMINFGTSDLMEDHKIIGGFRIPFNFKGFETYIKYINLKKRIDKSILYYRRSDRINFNVEDANGNVLPNVYTGKTRSNFFETQFSYPFDITKSLRWSFSYRYDRLDVSYIDEISRLIPDVKENWLSARLEFVHDNSKEIQYNIYNGFRYKIYAEYFYNANEKKSHIANIGFDVRYYQKVYRNIIWANRFAGASSFGPKKILYFLGGVDTWLNPKYATDIPIATDQNYGLQTSVTNLRGLPQNIRNGNNFLLWNSELRIPIFSFFAKKPLRSAFLRDFQLVGFFDAGIAYNFANPFDQRNSKSTEVVTPQPDNNPVVVTVDYYRNPFVFGTGAGFRTNILGYFIRLDTGFGYDGLQFNKKPIWHFSLSKDF